MILLRDMLKRALHKAREPKGALMDFGMILGTTVYLLMTLVVSLLLAIEIRVWFAEKVDPVKSRSATYRLSRRGSGAVLLLVVLVILRFSSADASEPFWKLLQILACLGLSLIVFLIAMLDLVVVRREIKQEFDGLQAEATGDFRRHLEGLAEENPKLAEKLPEILSQSLQEPDDSSPSEGRSAQGAS